jgi:hypothetical protein
MRPVVRIVAVLALVLGPVALVGPVQAGEWIPKVGPLSTRWTKDVSAEKALPEYPRPQMVRKDWLNLNGVWQLEKAGAVDAPPCGKDLPGAILVPYPVESALSGIMEQTERAWYRRTFEVPRGWAGSRVLLHFGAVDWEATVWVNGKSLGKHRGGYDPFDFDVTDALKAEGPQELVVGVFDPTDGGDQPRGKQVRKPGGIFYTPCTGIWQTVWIEPVPAARIVDLHIVPDVDAKCVRVTVLGTPEAAGREVRAGIPDASTEHRGKVGEPIVIPVESPRLWSPGSPFLYDLGVVLMDGDKPVDGVKSYFGLRKIEVAADGGVQKLLLNGKFLFQIGTLDQGFWPDGIYTAPTDEALRYDIEITKKLGFNLIRKHVKVEPERWYYWADKLGILVWQDMPSGNNRTPESKTQFEAELECLVRTHRNHPAIISWVVFNEGWGQYDTERLTGWVKGLDPTRFVNNASGWTDRGAGDVIDMHNYPGPGSPRPEARRAAVLGEFGGLGLAVPGHTWSKESWGYQGMAGNEQLTRRYTQLLQKTWGLVEQPGLCAAVYTQITDVETECNGLLTYDRTVVKPDLEKVAAANRGEVARVEIREVVSTSRKEPQTWRYTFEAPPDAWTAPEFDASGWKEGPGGFGTKGTPGSVVRTEWKTGDIWIRRTFEFPAEKPAGLEFLVHHDEDVEIFVNGVAAASAKGYLGEYEQLPMTDAGKAALKPGRNVLAVHCHQTSGGQFVDVGIVTVKEIPPAKRQF